MARRGNLSEVRRTEILHAAVTVIRERGLCDTRISDVAERAGTSAALVLYYFQTKDRLLADALSFSEERFYSVTFAELEGLDTATKRLVRLIELSCSPGAAATQEWLDEWMLWLDLWARAPRDPDVARDREALDRRWRHTIAGIVRDGQATGEFADVDPDDFALRLAVMVDGLAIQVVLEDPDVPASRMLTICLNMAAQELGFQLPARRGTWTPRARRGSGQVSGARTRSKARAARGARS